MSSQILQCVTAFLMAGVPSRSKVYWTPAISEMHSAVHLLKKLECTRYTLPSEYTLWFFSYIFKYFYSYAFTLRWSIIVSSFSSLGDLRNTIAFFSLHFIRIIYRYQAFQYVNCTGLSIICLFKIDVLFYKRKKMNLIYFSLFSSK